MSTKRLLLIVLFIIPIYTFSQSKKEITGFLGINFGSDAQTVKAAVLAKGGIFVESDSTPDMLKFNNLTLDNKKVFELDVFMVDNKAYYARFLFLPETEKQVFPYYNDLVDDINLVYGEGKTTNFIKTYHNVNKYKAIQSGHADYHTIWTKKENTISVYITPMASTIFISLSYVDNALNDMVIQRHKSDL